jgi:hypothetical protein
MHPTIVVNMHKYTHKDAHMHTGLIYPIVFLFLFLLLFVFVCTCLLCTVSRGSHKDDFA